jgi:ribosome biogenesis GTPase
LKSSALADLGWSARYLSLLPTEDATAPNVARLTTIARDRLAAWSPHGPLTLLTPTGQSTGDFTTGFWVTPTQDLSRVSRLLPRQTLLSRRAAGTGAADLLRPWAKAGQTLALVGSSGVGKTTL